MQGMDVPEQEQKLKWFRETLIHGGLTEVPKGKKLLFV